jgi:tRNA (guanine37-N1)-methyltransferase
LQKENEYDEIIYVTPDGEHFDQKLANQLSLKENLMIICGHYKGIDQRIRDHFITKEISVGDYVLSGGELAAAIIVDAIGRLIPGVLNDETSALFDSFQDDLLAPPVYTRPADFRGWKVPDELLSGNPRIIDEWRLEQSIRLTGRKRPNINKNQPE